MSKKATALFLLYVLVLSGCKKEDDITTAPPTTPPTTVIPTGNEALISANARVYLIADVEGLTGITKLNEQDTSRYVTSNWSSGHCYTGDCAYSGGLQSCNSTTNWFFKAIYYGTGETRQNLIVQQYTQLITSQSHGLELRYTAKNGKTYSSSSCNNASLSWANVTLVARETYTDVSPLALLNPTYYLKFKFNCQLANTANPSETIRLKNAVLRVAL